MPTIALFEETARRWQAAGRDPSLLSRGLHLVALRCWSHTTEGKRAPIGDTLSAFMAESEAAQSEGWYDALLAERGRCERCGETYRIENLAICTYDARTYCHFCLDERPCADTGQRICFCGEGEMVG